MKTAVLVSGFLRTFWFNCRNLIENLVAPNDADVFIYAGWDRNVQRVSTTASSTSTRDGIPLDFDEREVFGRWLGRHLVSMRFIEEERDDYIAEFRRIYPRCPYCMHLTIPNDGCRVVPQTETRLWHALDSYLRLRRCALLMESHERTRGSQYDAVVRIRGDLRLGRPLFLENYDLGPRRFYGEGGHPPAQRDCFFFGGRALVFDLCSRFVYEYGAEGRDGASDLREFRNALLRRGADIRLLDCVANDFNASPEAPKLRNLSPTRQCSCCLDFLPDIALDHENEIANRFGIRSCKVFIV